MADLQLCTVQDVKDYSGDVSALAQLLGGDTLDESYITKAIIAASGDVEASAGNKFQLSYQADATKYPQVIRRWTATLALRYCWIWKGRGQAMPPQVKEMVDEVLEALQRVEDGKKGMGQNAQTPARIHGYVTVDMTRGGTVARMTLDGMRKGFI